MDLYVFYKMHNWKTKCRNSQGSGVCTSEKENRELRQAARQFLINSVYFKSSVWLSIWLKMNMSGVPVCVNSAGTTERVWHPQRPDLHLHLTKAGRVEPHRERNSLYFIHAACTPRSSPLCSGALHNGIHPFEETSPNHPRGKHHKLHSFKHFHKGLGRFAQFREWHWGMS